MLGLLGTVTGMIQSFDQLAAGRSEPQDLVGGTGSHVDYSRAPSS